MYIVLFFVRCLRHKTICTLFLLLLCDGLFHSYLSDPAFVSASFKIGGEESLHDLQRLLLGDEAGRDTYHVGVVVLAA